MTTTNLFVIVEMLAMTILFTDVFEAILALIERWFP